MEKPRHIYKGFKIGKCADCGRPIELNGTRVVCIKCRILRDRSYSKKKK